MKVKIQVDDADAIVSVHRKEDDSIVGSVEEIKPHKPFVVSLTAEMYAMVMTDQDAPEPKPGS